LAKADVGDTSLKLTVADLTPIGMFGLASLTRSAKIKGPCELKLFVMRPGGVSSATLDGVVTEHTSSSLQMVEGVLLSSFPWPVKLLAG